VFVERDSALRYFLRLFELLVKQSCKSRGSLRWFHSVGFPKARSDRFLPIRPSQNSIVADQNAAR